MWSLTTFIVVINKDLKELQLMSEASVSSLDGGLITEVTVIIKVLMKRCLENGRI